MKPNKHLLFIFATVLALTLPTVAKAQLRYGLNLGGSFAGATIDRSPGYDLVNRSGFRGGLTLEYQLPTCGLAFDASVLYNRFNTRLKDESQAERIDFGRDYLEVPIHIKYKFWLPATSNLVAPMVLTGPSLLCHLSSNDSPMKVKRFQPGWNVGVGLDIANILQISGGYRFGLTNIAEEFGPAPETRIKSSGFFLSALLLFDF